MINLFKTLVNTHSDAHQSVATVLDTFKVAVRQHNDFREIVQSFQNQLSNDLQISGEKAEAFFTLLVKNLAQATKNLIENITVPLRHVQNRVSGLDNVRTLLML